MEKKSYQYDPSGQHQRCLTFSLRSIFSGTVKGFLFSSVSNGWETESVNTWTPHFNKHMCNVWYDDVNETLT
jgi:hypothetical protein